MNASNCCTPCQSLEVVDVPGTEGAAGAAGAAGTDGVNAFTVLTAALTLPAIGANETLFVADNSWAIVGQTIVVSDPSPGVDFGTFQVVSKTGTTAITATFIGASGDSAPGSVIAIGGGVSPGGAPGTLSAALPTALTDNSTGTASNTIAVGTGKFTHSIFFRAAAITGNVLLYTYTPGFAFKIVRISSSVVDAITTAARAATLTTAIAATPTTGGVVTLAGAYALGAEQASSAAITAANTGTSAQAITVTASAVTAFAEGGFMLHMEIQNTDSANAIASLADHTNDLITSLS